MRKSNKKGFILLEMMLVVLMIGMIGTWITALLLTEHQTVLSQVEEETAYYAAVSTVHLMAESVMKEEGLLDLEDENLDKTSGTLCFQSDDTEVFIPVNIWMECNEDEKILYSEAGTGKSAKTVSLTLEYDQVWYPVKYELVEKGKDE